MEGDIKYVFMSDPREGDDGIRPSAEPEHSEPDAKDGPRAILIASTV